MAAADTRMRHLWPNERRHGRPSIWVGYCVVLFRVALGVPALDWGTSAHLEYRDAGRVARIHLYRRRESRLRSGGLPAGAEFRRNLAGRGVSDQVADHFRRFYLPAICPMRLFRHHLS